MSEFESQNAGQSLIPTAPGGKDEVDQDYMNEFKAQAQEYSQKFQDAAIKAREFANEKFTQAGEKLKELQNKDPKQIMEDAKEYARQKPGQTILISAAIGLLLGFILKRK
jgi:ElaB/YqjD/DUF883 family membrane-anchored ribosome-binding protein